MERNDDDSDDDNDNSVQYVFPDKTFIELAVFINRTSR